MTTNKNQTKDDEYLLICRMPALTDDELQELMRKIRDYDTGDAQISIVPDSYRKTVLKLLEEF